MTRITGTDQVLLLLQEQLHRLGKDRAQRRGASAAVGTPAPLARLRALAAREGVSDEDLQQALVRSLIVAQLGEGIAGDPAFEAVAVDVARIIADSAAGRALLEQALGELGKRPA